MKRDARIGLAVVLVLGLAVTLLIGRALCKRGAEVSENDADSGSGTGASYSTDVTRVGGADATATANATPARNAAPIIEATEPPNAGDAQNPALQRFIDDNSRRLSAGDAAATTSAAPAPAPAARGMSEPGRATAPLAPAPVAPTNGNGSTPAPQPAPAPAQPNREAWADHESTPSATESDTPAGGYGYVVVSGDNVWKISSKVYGDGKFSQKIVDANPELKSGKMKIGTIIKIPVITNKTVLMKLPSYADALKGKSAPAGRPAANDGPVAAEQHLAKPADQPAASGEQQLHKVQSGETLASIAQKYYGFSGPKSVAKIVLANKGLEASKLKVGQEIVIPAKK